MSKDTKSQNQKPAFLPRFLAGIGYMLCLLQWLWVIILVLPALLDSGLLQSLAPPPVEQVQEQSASSEASSPLLIVLGVAVTAVMLIVSVIVLIKFPIKVAQTGNTLTHKAADAIVPVISNHKKLSAKKKWILTQRIMFYVKAVLVLIPLTACFLVPYDASFSREIVVFVGGVLATLAMCFFAFEIATVFIQSKRSRINNNPTT